MCDDVTVVAEWWWGIFVKPTNEAESEEEPRDDSVSEVSSVDFGENPSMCAFCYLT